MSTEKKIVDVPTEHPLEDLFDIDSGSTLVPAVKRTTEMAVSEDVPYDQKDDEIDGQFQEIYDTALEAYQIQAEEADMVEGKYKARNQEIAVQLLNTALNAAANRGTLKTNKEKLRIAAQKATKAGTTTNNNMVVGSTTEILRMMREAKKAEGDEDPAVIATQD